eukprot:CAMPEP_0170585528 /NCGR_PEP_ID=MMETSP0224-20130122/9262_1 /TAXON_ID=285029 /ORGANISM="Togula jolla, Strain CCCM 725" /LENGTH=383 /DNA_ID=CAMNT_0010909019 /DNA_START=33 /DNA_END=1184 /DNA_ORIENTATION=+
MTFLLLSLTLLPALTLQYGRPSISPSLRLVQSVEQTSNQTVHASPLDQGRSLGSSFLQNRLRHRTGLNVSNSLEHKDYAACKAEMDPEVRTFLRIVVQAGHGSTALESILMSSPKIATLCSSEMWQCEGHKLLESMGHGLATDEIDTHFMLSTYSQYWNLDRPVLLDKKTKMLDHLPKQDAALLKSELPYPMKFTGIKRIDTAYIIMYKPVCLWPMSKDLVMLVRNDAGAHARSETKRLQQLVEVHKYFSDQGRPPMVVNYADMVWNPDYVQRELKKYLPCLGDVDMDFRPKLGQDVYEENKMKIDLGVKSYGMTQDPWDCCRYNIGNPGKNKPGKCASEWGMMHEDAGFAGPLEKFLSSEEKAQLDEAVAYLEKQSLHRRTK